MATQQDMMMFVTGVVGRSMGSGKFDPDDILRLTERAKDAFVATYGEPASAPVASAPPAKVGTAHSFGAVAQSMGVGAETTPMEVWGGDRAYLGWKDNQFEGEKEPDVTWGKWFMYAQEGNARALDVLRKAAASDPNKGDPKWHAANRKRVARAKAVLALVGA